MGFVISVLARISFTLIFRELSEWLSQLRPVPFGGLVAQEGGVIVWKNLL
jgi:hypothetical protein